jgi:hypothetical protein
VIARKMPAAFDDAGYRVTVAECVVGNQGASAGGRGTAVTSDRLK